MNALQLVRPALEMAEKSNIQLIGWTGINDMNVLGLFPMVISLRRRVGVTNSYVEVEGVRENGRTGDRSLDGPKAGSMPHGLGRCRHELRSARSGTGAGTLGKGDRRAAGRVRIDIECHRRRPELVARAGAVGGSLPTSSPDAVRTLRDRGAVAPSPTGPASVLKRNYDHRCDPPIPLLRRRSGRDVAVARSRALAGNIPGIPTWVSWSGNGVSNAATSGWRSTAG